MPWPKPPPPGVFCATPYHMAMRDITAQVRASVLRADWPAPPGVHALTTLRGPVGDSLAPFNRFNLGLRSGDDAQAVIDNRVMLGHALDLPSAPRWLRQVHGTSVAGDGDASDGDAGEEEPEADASVSTHPDAVLAILSADCLPVVFSACDGSEIGAAHAGWRGLSAGVLEATLASMRSAPAQVIAWMGPAAGPQAYEVGGEVREAFVSRDPQAVHHFVATRPGHWLVDLYALAIDRLVDAGMPRAAIHGGGLCTISEPKRFYSHRRDQRTGRMATLVWRSAPAGADDQT